MWIYKTCESWKNKIVSQNEIYFYSKHSFVGFLDLMNYAAQLTEKISYPEETVIEHIEEHIFVNNIFFWGWD